MELAGKRALVIGGGGDGIGRGITRAFGRAGAAVVVADINPDHAEQAVQELQQDGVRACAFPGDVRTPGKIEEWVGDTVRHLGGLDVLVTVVGGQVAFVPAVRLHEMADDDWDTIYELNMRYVARAVRAALGVFLDQGSPGTIISVGSVTGFMAAPRQAAYGVMKAGLVSLARTVAAEYAAEGIRMNVVAGGAIATAAANTGGQGGWVDEIPMGRYGTVDDIASAATFLASDESSYITGQQVVVDGGVSVRGPFE